MAVVKIGELVGTVIVGSVAEIGLEDCGTGEAPESGFASGRPRRREGLISA